MLFETLVLVYFLGLGFAVVHRSQGSLYTKYEVGDSATLYCNVSTDEEVVNSCTFLWEITDELKNDFIDITTTPKYHNRVSVASQDLSSMMTIRDLADTDTDEIMCTPLCYIYDDLRYILGNGTTLKITEQEKKIKEQENLGFPWLKYLIFSLNCIIFSISMVICIYIIRKRRFGKCAQNE